MKIDEDEYGDLVLKNTNEDYIELGAILILVFGAIMFVFALAIL